MDRCRILKAQTLISAYEGDGGLPAAPRPEGSLLLRYSAPLMKRVLVIGCPGSGKSVLSQELARRTGLPLIHLDAIYHRDIWDASGDVKKRQWRETVAGLIAQEVWIMDGNYKSTLDIRVPAADTVIFLDYPRRISLARAFRRQWQYRARRRPDMPPEWKEHMSLDFLKFIWNYRRVERPKVLALISEYERGRDIRVLEHPAEAERFLRSL